MKVYLLGNVIKNKRFLLWAMLERLFELNDLGRDF